MVRPDDLPAVGDADARQALFAVVVNAIAVLVVEHHAGRNLGLGGVSLYWSLVSMFVLARRVVRRGRPVGQARTCSRDSSTG